MDTIANHHPGGRPAASGGRAPARARPSAQAPGKLPPGFDAEAFAREACARSGVTFPVTDPVALSKLRVLTRPGG
ncbi:MAG: hypothetical protein LBK95_21355 [Bifidobacteriaceae bacterium]|jgi:hypothetical protein|nr:hypothetical protein [Bifidobacteriaceae bacterium]